MFEKLLKRPIIIIFAALLLMLAGISSLRGISVDLFPDLNYPLINVITHFPAGSAEDMEQLITRPIESAMMGLNELQRVRSTSAPGFSQVTIEFVWGVNAEQARQRVFSRLAQIKSLLPNNAEPTLENIGSSLARLSTYLLKSSDPAKLRTWVDTQLSPQLARLKGVARVHVMGGNVLTWRVDIDPIKLQQSQTNIIQVSEAIKKANVLDTGGYIAQQGRDLLIQTDGRLQSIDDLKKVFIRQSEAGYPVVLADVANIYQGAKPQRYQVSQNTLPAVAVTIQKQAKASSLVVSNEVDNLLNTLKLPLGVEISKFYDQAEIIGLTYKNMRNHLIIGAVLAIMVVVFILGYSRTSLVIALTFPLTVLATFWVMHVLNLGFNLMTLGALTVAIGMVADDAIIVLENIDRHQRLGGTPWQATIRGTKEILAADISGTLTILAAFAPLVLVNGLAGRLFHPFGLSFSILLLFSLLISVTVIPLAAIYWSKNEIKNNAVNNKISLADRLVQKVTKLNINLLDYFIKYKKSTFVSAAILLVASSLLLTFNPMRFLPLLDEHSLMLSYQLAPGTSLKESNRIGQLLEKQILLNPNVSGVFRRTGSPESSFYLEGTNQGELLVRLKNKPEINVLKIKSSLEQLLNNMPGIVWRVNEPTSEKLDESFSGMPTMFGITIFGTDLSSLYKAAGQVEKAAKHTAGVFGVVNNTKIAIDQLQVKLSPENLALRNVQAKQAATAVKQAIQGEILTTVIKNQQNIGVFLRYDDKYRTSVEHINKVLVPNIQGRNILLSQIAEIEQHSVFPAIEHQYGLRSLTLSAEIEGDPLSIIKRLTKNIAKLNLPSEIQVRYTGEYQKLIDTSIQMIGVILGAALLVYGIIALQLGNLLDPFIVLVKLPLDFIGAALALFVTQQPLDLTILIGFVALIGVSTNNGIMLLTFTQKLRKQGLDALSAVKEAARLRTRPMLLTHLTTLLALIPAALGFGEGPQLLQPMGIMLFGGLSVGALLTLNFLPVIYVATEKWRLK